MRQSRTPQLGTPASANASGALARLDALASLRPFGGHRHLDLGCGNGLYTRQIARSYVETVGVEVEPVRLAEFSAELEREAGTSIRTVHADGANLPFPDAHFDSVSAIEVLEHVDRLTEALQEVRRVLAPGGAFYVTVPNRLFRLETHSVTIAGHEIDGRCIPFLPWCPVVHTRWANARIYTWRSLVRQLTNAGFTVSKPAYIAPPFDHAKRLGRVAGPVLRWLQRTPMRAFAGVSLIVVATKADNA